jgi:hypothetical protein
MTEILSTLCLLVGLITVFNGALMNSAFLIAGGIILIAIDIVVSINMRDK